MTFSHFLENFRKDIQAILRDICTYLFENRMIARRLRDNYVHGEPITIEILERGFEKAAEIFDPMQSKLIL